MTESTPSRRGFLKASGLAVTALAIPIPGKPCTATQGPVARREIREIETKFDTDGPLAGSLSFSPYLILGHVNSGPIFGYPASTVMFTSMTREYRSDGSIGYSYGFAHRAGGWNRDGSGPGPYGESDLGRLYPGGIVPSPENLISSSIIDFA